MFRLRSFWVFFLFVSRLSAYALREIKVEPTGSSKMADMTQSKNASPCGDSWFGKVYWKAPKYPVLHLQEFVVYKTE